MDSSYVNKPLRSTALCSSDNEKPRQHQQIENELSWTPGIKLRTPGSGSANAIHCDMLPPKYFFFTLLFWFDNCDARPSRCSTTQKKFFFFLPLFSHFDRFCQLRQRAWILDFADLLLKGIFHYKSCHKRSALLSTESNSGKPFCMT